MGPILGAHNLGVSGPPFTACGYELEEEICDLLTHPKLPRHGAQLRHALIAYARHFKAV